MTRPGEELHEFGWNASSSMLCPNARTSVPSGATSARPGSAPRASHHRHQARSEALLALGAFHGLNPAMGWLFAVALGPGLWTSSGS
jgi:hypothetical protein